MLSAGYMAKRLSKRPDWLHAANVTDVYSVSGCISEDFADYIPYWKHNGYWFFDAPAIINTLAREHSINIEGTSMFYYEAYEKEFDGENWLSFAPEASFPTNVVPPLNKQLEGFDVVNFTGRSSAECSPLSCNSLAEKIATNAHCLLASLEEAIMHINSGAFDDSEPPPFRIFAVYSVGDWP